MLRLIAAVDAGLAIGDFVVRPLTATPADPRAAIRGGVVFGLLALGAAVARRRRSDPPVPVRGRSTDTVAAEPAHPANAAVTGATILAVHAGERLVEVFWDGPPPPPRPPWRSSPTGWVWEADCNRLADPLEPARPWLPVVVALGTTPTGTLWLNLGAFRVVALVGDPAAAADRVDGFVRQLEPRAGAGAVELSLLDAGGTERRDRSADAELADPLARGSRRAAHRTASAHRSRRRRGVGGAPEVGFLVAIAPTPGAEGIAHGAGGDPDRTVVAVGDLPDADLRLWCGNGQVQVPFLGDLTVAVPEPSAQASDALTVSAHPRRTRGESVPSPQSSAAAAGHPSPTVNVGVLGPVEVHGADGALAGKSLELVAYLACHPEGVHEDRVRAALWPERAPSAKTWSNRVSTTRQILGPDRDDTTRLRRLPGHVAQLAPSVRTDLDVLEAAVTTAREAPGPDATDALADALAAVRGRPFGMPSGYAWADAEGHVAHAERVVVDAAHHLAELALAATDGRQARWATHQGLLACPKSDVLLEDRRRAHDAAPDRVGAMDGIRDLLQTIGAPDLTAAARPDVADLFEALRGTVGSAPSATSDEV